MKRAVIYVRVSSRDQAEGGYSLEAQLGACRQFVADHGWALVGEYVDAGESAKTADRPQLKAMLAAIRDNPAVSYLVVHKIDRFARNLEDHVRIRAELRQRGVALVSASEDLEDSPSGRMVEGILASISAWYSENLGQETRKGMLQKARNGIWPSVAPVGYRNVRNGEGRRSESVIVPDPAMAPLVQQAFELYASGECPLTELHTEMVRRGMRTFRGGAITRSQLARMLRNPTYIGIVKWADLTVQGTHEPLVSQELFDRVQEVFRVHDKAGARLRDHPHYLKGSVVCASCGSRLSLTIAKGRYKYFFCIGRQQRRTRCGEAYIPSDELEAQVEEFYRGIAFTDSMRDRIRASMEREIGSQLAGSARIARQNAKRLSQLQIERERLLHAWYAKAIEIDLLRKEQERIASEVEAIEQRANFDIEKLQEAKDVAEGAMRLLRDCYRSYRAARKCDEARRLWNRALFKKIAVSGRQVTRVEYAEPFRTLLEAGKFEYRASGSPYRIRTGGLCLERAVS